MKSKFAKRLIGIFFLISILITCIAAIYVGKNFASDKSSMHEAMIQELPTGWEYEEFGERKEIDQLPTTVQLNEKSESLTLYYRLPEELPQNACLEFISQQTSVEVMIDGRVNLYIWGAQQTSGGQASGEFAQCHCFAQRCWRKGDCHSIGFAVFTEPLSCRFDYTRQ